MVVGDITSSTTLLVIGAGPAGYVTAIRAAQYGIEVTLVERAEPGGTCLNHGCIPSKALIDATDVAHTAATAEDRGIHADPAVDLAGMVEWKDGVVDQLTTGIDRLCKANSVNLVEGTARFADEHTARIAGAGEGQGSSTLEFDHAVIATGSRPIELPTVPFDGEVVIDSRRALTLEAIPDSMVVVGGGYIGMELASVFAKLGTDVTVLEQLDAILPAYDDAVTRPVARRANDLGIDVECGCTVEGVERTGETARVETTTEEGETETHATDCVLVAVGREPVTDTLGLGAINLEPSPDGFLETDATGRTAHDHIYAVGDVAGEPMLAHAGMHDGRIAAAAIADEPLPADPQAVPTVVFTDPEIATVGQTEAEAESAGFDPVVGTFPFRASGRALSTGRPEGQVTIVADATEGYILGGQIVGTEASELIAEIGLAIELGATLEDLVGTVHTHPTRSEAVMEAAENALDRAIHTLNR
ncbi:MAG: dihydrolipoyl dehydrogenase [Natrialbaceae archaeon]|nr:dihydrolipoyl dehydrogenase [Natrialbaceae archaeon]